MALLAKICLLGNGGVGKTSLRNNFLGIRFSTDYLPTLGSDFVTKKITLHTSNSSNEIKFQIWDLAGQPSFKQIRKLYYRRAVGALLLYDITNPGSLESLETWLKELIEHSGSTNIQTVILGNKNDMREDSANCISYEKAESYINNVLKIKFPNMEFKHLETSAKTGENVEKAFYSLAEDIMNSIYVNDT